ncbi:hypothetical protein GWI33_003365 [Rhynchophorus ferrugineus]|uniref:Myosuppressin n=1 Tax=Rhynchophorus ferrugineus TaxID=354439 RepID=A0A834J3K6_RHYFE|nr:hypothetical protein GWI33_003365 [Rhynchophorus ferrugineus]
MLYSLCFNYETYKRRHFYKKDTSTKRRRHESFESIVHAFLDKPRLSYQKQILKIKMKTAFGTICLSAVVALYCLSSASVINCPPNGYFQQDTNSKLNQLCSIVEQALMESSPQNDRYLWKLTDDRNTNLNVKRQDVDHVFLRFGRAGL